MKSNDMKLGLIIFLLISALMIAGNSLAAEYLSVMNDGVNVRSGPSTKDDIIFEVFQDFPFMVIGREGEWVQVVDYEDAKGWVYASLLTKDKNVIVKVDIANMRSAPDKDSQIIATAKKGVVFKPVDKNGNWLKVSYKNEVTGWIYNTLVFPSNP